MIYLDKDQFNISKDALVDIKIPFDIYINNN